MQISPVECKKKVVKDEEGYTNFGWLLGANKFVTVPKAGLWRAMKRNDRVKRLEFSRHMSRKQVKNVLMSNFPSLRLTSSVFMKAKCDNKMEEVRQEDEAFPNGTDYSESLYLIESSNVQVNETTHFYFHYYSGGQFR